MRGNRRNAQYILKEAHTAMIMTQQHSMLYGITPQENCMEHAYLSMQEQQT
jgi:hypothetical protein